VSTVALSAPRLGSALAPLDRTLGRVTMYRLVLLLLAALALIALIMSLTGTLDYEPEELLLSAAVAIGVAYGANRLIAPLFRVRPHGESALITGLLLFFIFWPTSEGDGLLHLAVAALVATLSKYLLVWRGRHVLNPAAAGAVFVGVLQIDASVWWVGGKELLPYVVVAGLLVLYRTRRLPMAAVFVVVATGIITIRLAGDGQSTGDALTTALQSYPILFFVSFMLSEPLTLPPRRFQQLGLAVLVGALFAIPMSVGSVAMTPELALVLGNLAAFAVARRSGVRLRFVQRRELGPTTGEYVFAPIRPLAFRPGQYAELTLPHRGPDRRGVRRTFTIASAPASAATAAGVATAGATTTTAAATPAATTTTAATATAGTVAFGIREAPAKGSSFKRALAALEPGTVVSATTVAGDFLLPRDRTAPLLLVAGGIGVTPFVSQLRAEADEEPRDAVLVYGVTPGEGLPYRDELQRAGVPVVLVSPEAPADLPAGWTHVAADRISEDVLRRAVSDAKDRRAYVSGPPAMVDAVRAALRRLGVRRVRTDHFAGY
jgi:ferredoxin-NADP reductase